MKRRKPLFITFCALFGTFSFIALYALIIFSAVMGSDLKSAEYYGNPDNYVQKDCTITAINAGGYNNDSIRLIVRFSENKFTDYSFTIGGKNYVTVEKRGLLDVLEEDTQATIWVAKDYAYGDMYWHDELAGITYKGENFLYYINGAAQISERYLEAYNEEHIAQIVFGVIFAVTSLLFIADFIIYFVIAKPTDKDKAQKPKVQATPDIKNSVEQLIGNTPLVRLEKTERLSASRASLYAKLEMLNPSGSVKDRAALTMIYDAENRGLLSPGATIVEPTSGNTGIGLAMIAARRGYKLILTMPDTMSVERQKLLKAYGAEIILTEGSRGMKGAVERAQMLKEEIGAFMPEQFTNQANPNAHYTSTGPEIWRDTAGGVDILVAGVGTGGTISGAGRYLKAQKSDIKVVAVEPKSSPVLSGGSAGAHGIQGIGAGFIPSVLDRSAYDEVFTVTDEQAYIAARQLAKTEGLLVGISSGAALHAAIELSRMEANAGKNIVVILPDSGDRYLSTPLYGEEPVESKPPTPAQKPRKKKNEAQ